MSTTTAFRDSAPSGGAQDLKVAAVARRLGVSPSTVYRLARDGALAHTRVRSGITIPADVLEAYQQAQTSTAWTPVGRLSSRGRRPGQGAQ